MHGTNKKLNNLIGYIIGIPDTANTVIIDLYRRMNHVCEGMGFVRAYLCWFFISLILFVHIPNQSKEFV